jgi:phage tail sheath protein FI
MSAYLHRATPGVYITELPAFPPSIIGVQTAVPVFIGYTEKAIDPVSQKPIYLTPTMIASLADYQSYFGVGFRPKFSIAVASQNAYDFMVPATDGNPSDAQYYDVVQSQSSTFYMYNALRLFYANGGGNCYIVSCANYNGQQDNQAPGPTDAGTTINEPKLAAGLDASGSQVGPTMVVIPDACQLSQDDYASLTAATLSQCGTLQDRVAILDLCGSTDPASWDPRLVEAQQAAFTLAVASSADYYSYGTAYYPALKTSITTASEIDWTFLNIFGSDSSTATTLATLLETQTNTLYPVAKQPAQNAQVMTAISQMLPLEVVLSPPVTPVPPADAVKVTQLNQFLVNALPLMKQIENIIQANMNVAPVSGPIAGIWSRNDQNRGVWNAPANLGLTSVISPTILLTDAQQGPLNLPLDGVAIDVVRYFVNRGPVVWGARTLDGNSNDYRYIQVRRTLIYIEQSIKTALQQMVFAPNVGQTWVSVTASISNFLTGLWTQGGLMGDKASDAFSVQCGLGSTMTAQDVLNGYMIVSVTLQMVHPAEFIELTFTQEMQGA